MIFAYLKVAEKLSHVDAFAHPTLRGKRMGNKMPNGNIIVDGKGEYNRYDANAHRHMFDRIRRHYVVGDTAESRMLTAPEIQRLAPAFVPMLAKTLKRDGVRAIDIISRKGRVLTVAQVKALLAWLGK